MGLVYLLIAVFSDSAAGIVDKLNYKRNKITPQQILFVSFAAMAVLMAMYVLVAKIPLPHIGLLALALLAIIGLIAFGANAFDYLSLKADDVSLREPLRDFEPIVAGLVGYALFPAERKSGFLLAFILGAAVVYWGSHRRRLGKLQAKGMFYMLLAICLYGLLPSLYKLALNYLPPAYITLFRAMLILAFTSIIFPPKNITKISAQRLTYSIVSGVLYAVYAVTILYAIMQFGVVVTMLLSLFGPALRYLVSYLVLKENVRKGELVASTLLALIVLVPIVM